MANTLVAQFQAAIAGIYAAILPIAQNLFILLAALVLFITEWIPMDVTALLVLATLAAAKSRKA